MRYPAWFPYPSSWLNAILLTLLTVVSSHVVRWFFQIGFNFAKFTNEPEPFILLSIAALLSPVVVVAFTHHFICLGLAKLSPKPQSSQIGITTGILPSLQSWWEGLWSWLVMVVSFLLVLLVATSTHSFFDIDFAPMSGQLARNEERFATLLSVVWLGSAAYLYQISHLVERQFIEIGSKNLK